MKTTLFILSALTLVCLNVSAFGQEKATTIQAANKKLLLFVVEELFNKGDTTIADKYFVPEFAQEEKAFTRQIRASFPDLKMTVDILVAENDMVAARWIASGTQKGKFLGVEPTNKFVTWKGSWFWTFQNGKITDGMGKGSWDALGLLKQLQSK
jgi:predicted ester cyclase